MPKQKDKKPRCPNCSTTQIRFRMNTKTFWCRVCGHEWKKKLALLLCFLLLTTSAFAGSVEQAKAEIEQMELTGVSVKTVDLKTFTQDQEARIKEAIGQVNAKTQAEQRSAE